MTTGVLVAVEGDTDEPFAHRVVVASDSKSTGCSY